MGLFGFGKKKRRDDDDETEAKANEAEAKDEDAVAQAEDDKATETSADADKDAGNDAVKDSGDEGSEAESDAESDADADDDEADERKVPDEPSEAYPDRGELYGPWDIDEEDAPDYDEYLDMGAYYLPFMPGIELRVKANRASGQVLGCTVSYKASSLEIEALAAPKTLSLWDGVSEDLLAANPKASQQPGIFGTEIKLPVTVKGSKTLVTRIVGVDGPRWMLRGIFSGRAATHPESPETKALNQFFSDIVVDRGEEPLAPRDLIPMHAPVSPEERRKADEAAAAAAEKDGKGHKIPKRIKGPFVADQQTEVQTTISRGPMFSELR
ncbi:DUF3710 domain-containing protein [Bifidobacterium sp. ESL0775]|uniref:DUF3710 domain-containing protein n=1 Tax=Bifidobacterium sp. ESL0775 TaxID=2983230 RepID=UPI0023F8CC3F|nr:DUF3710 domain-containing protein [Bifidobacterium sp. ESL0775]WEV69844.1 DUF3710 domain-containing protein [Bifidobacterium sp. ESL0775]